MPVIFSLGRSIAGTGNEQDVDLDGEYYVMYGRSDGSTSSGSLITHRSANPPTNPSISDDQPNIAEDAQSGGALGLTTPVHYMGAILALVTCFMFMY